jgi:hypothetical protein
MVSRAQSLGFHCPCRSLSNPIAADAVVCFSFADREKKTLALLVYFSYRLLGGSKAARRTREALHKLGFFFL